MITNENVFEQINLINRDMGFIEEKIKRHEGTQFSITPSDRKRIMSGLKKARRAIANLTGII